MREKYEYYQSHRELVDEILRQGSEKAKQIASKKLYEIKKLIGVEK